MLECYYKNRKEKSMYIADMHCDSILRVSADRGLVTKENISAKLPQLQLFATFVPHGGASAEARRRRLMHYLDVYLSECQRLGLVQVRNCHDLNFAIEFQRNAAVFAVEGGGGLFCDSEELGTLYQAGLRVLGMAWESNELAASAWEENDYGLTDAGRALAERCCELGIILDVSHLSDRSACELLDLTAYPLLATHSNFRDICASPRNLTRELASKIAARGGVIGINLYPPFLNDSGEATDTDILRHIDFGLEHFGEDSIGFGFDIDGTDGRYPQGYGGDSIHDKACDMLLSHYSASVVEKLAGGNVINFCRNNL